MIGKKSGGSLEILNRNLKAQKPNSVFKQNNRTLDTNVTLSLRIKDCDSSPFKLKFKCTKCNVVYNVKNETLDVFPSQRIVKLESSWRGVGSDCWFQDYDYVCLKSPLQDFQGGRVHTLCRARWDAFLTLNAEALPCVQLKSLHLSFPFVQPQDWHQGNPGSLWCVLLNFFYVFQYPFRSKINEYNLRWHTENKITHEFWTLFSFSETWWFCSFSKYRSLSVHTYLL